MVFGTLYFDWLLTLEFSLFYGVSVLGEGGLCLNNPLCWPLERWSLRSLASFFLVLLSCPENGTARVPSFIDLVFEAVEDGRHLKMILWTPVGAAAATSLGDSVKGLCFLISRGLSDWHCKCSFTCNLGHSVLSWPGVNHWGTERKADLRKLLLCQ